MKHAFRFFNFSCILLVLGVLCYPLVLSATALPTVSIHDGSVNEHNSGHANMTFNVRLSAASTSRITVRYTTANVSAADGSSCGGSADYITGNGTLTFNAGTTLMAIAIAVCGDTALEPDETFRVNLSHPSSNATITDSVGQISITNDD